MGIAAGGLIKQCIVPENNPASIWDTDRSIGFNVQNLNSDVFRYVTGMSPLDSPISKATYAEEGFPFFQIWNETSNIKGDFCAVKSVRSIDDEEKQEAGGEVVAERPWSGSIVTLDPKGKSMRFVPVSKMEEELTRTRSATF